LFKALSIVAQQASAAEIAAAVLNALLTRAFSHCQQGSHVAEDKEAVA
jgi:hypothetical protein